MKKERIATRTDEKFWEEVQKHWNYEKNEKNWSEYTRGSKDFIYLNCENVTYHVYKIRCCSFDAGARCNYCSASGKTHPLDSFAQWGIDNICEDFLEKYWDSSNVIDPFKLRPGSDKKISIICQEKSYHGNYDIATKSFHEGCRCGCCNMQSGKVHPLDSIGTLFPQVSLIWSDKNIKSEFEYAPRSTKKVWFKCPCGKHKDYPKTPDKAGRDEFRCPECTRERTESILQEKTRLYLGELGYKLNHEHNCTILPRNPKNLYILPFDNEVIDLKLVIEVMGLQHYRSDYTWGIIENKEADFHKRQLYDRYKRMYAKTQGYSYLAIPYWTDNATEDYKKLIDNKILILNNIV